MSNKRGKKSGNRERGNREKNEGKDIVDGRSSKRNSESP